MVEQDCIFKIQRYSIHDGPGIRTALFFQGCPLSCQWCHNPESQTLLFKDDIKDLDRVVSILMEEIEKDLIFYDESGGGVTFSGGEPLCQPELLFRLLDQCREKDIHTCVDTSGYAERVVLLKAAEKADLILYDIKLFDDIRHETYAGKSNGLILDNLIQLSGQRANVRLRFPLVPGITDSEENMDQFMVFLKENTNFRDIHILPFHKAGEGKYEALGLKNEMKDLQPPSSQRVSGVKNQFESKGFNITIGG